MKITSYEISKQLAEAGFAEAGSDASPNWSCWAWVKLNGDLLGLHLSQFHLVDPKLEKIAAYNLETILDALPPKIARGEGRSPTSSFIFTKNGMGYAQKPQIEFQEFINRQENESLADTAAKLWLKLKKEGLV